MKLYINAYNREGVPLAELKELGWYGARRDVSSLEEARAVIGQHEGVGMEAILLLNLPPAEAAALAIEIVQHAARRAWPIEVGNEWDLTHSPEDARDAWWRVAAAAAAARMPPGVVVTGGISSLSSTALSWLEAALPKPPWWDGLVCGFHAYNGNRALDREVRASELRNLRGVIGLRRAWNTETGWHQASVPKDFPLCWWRRPGLSERQVTDYLVADLVEQERAGVENYVVYQIDDGPRDTPMDRYGIRASDGRWKLQAHVPAGFPAAATGRRG